MGTMDDERAKRRELIRRLLFERDRDGLTLAELSVRSGIPTGTLGSWVARLRREGHVESATEPPRRSAGFVELVPSASDHEAPSPGFEVVLKGERRVVVPPAFDESALVRLVRALEAC